MGPEQRKMKQYETVSSLEGVIIGLSCESRSASDHITDNNTMYPDLD